MPKGNVPKDLAMHLFRQGSAMLEKGKPTNRSPLGCTKGKDKAPWPYPRNYPLGDGAPPRRKGQTR